MYFLNVNTHLFRNVSFVIVIIMKYRRLSRESNVAMSMCNMQKKN